MIFAVLIKLFLLSNGSYFVYLKYFQVSLQDWDDKVYVAYYNSIKVANKTENYKLTLTGYDDVRSTLADSFTAGGHATAEFTTYDKDNDNLASGNCANTYSGGNNDM